MWLSSRAGVLDTEQPDNPYVPSDAYSLLIPPIGGTKHAVADRGAACPTDSSHMAVTELSRNYAAATQSPHKRMFGFE